MAAATSWREQREQELVINFISLTGATEEVARLHLDAKGWNLTWAIGDFQQMDLSNRPEVRPTLNPVRAETQSPAFLPAANPAFATVVVDEPMKPSPQRSSTQGTGSTKRTKRRERTSNLMTLAELDSSSDEESKGSLSISRTECFATRGQLAPFGEEDKHHVLAFSGTGHALDPEAARMRREALEKDASRRECSVVVTFWRNGYTVDCEGKAGGLRRMSERRHRDFLRSLNDGVVPFELTSLVPDEGSVVFKIQLVDMKRQRYPGSLPAFPQDTQSVSAPRETREETRVRFENRDLELPSNVEDDEYESAMVEVRLWNGERARFRFRRDQRLSEVYEQVERRVGAAAPPDKEPVLRKSYPREILRRDPLNDPTLQDLDALDSLLFLDYL